MPLPPPIPSPCITVCRVDEPRGLCLGCGRTLDEIAAWATCDDAMRADVLTALPARLDALGELAADKPEALARIAQALAHIKSR